MHCLLSLGSFTHHGGPWVQAQYQTFVCLLLVFISMAVCHQVNWCSMAVLSDHMEGVSGGMA